MFPMNPTECITRTEISHKGLGLLLLCLVCGSAGDHTERHLGNFTFGVQEIVNKVSHGVEEQFLSRVQLATTCGCSRHACSNVFEPSHACTSELGNNEMCGEDCVGMKLNFNGSYVRTPPGSRLDALPSQVEEALCIHQGLDPIFRDIDETGGMKTWTYFGSMAGVMRIWPGKSRKRGLTDGSFDPDLGNCRTYDPRLRPWYIAAVTSSGLKDVVILLDTSESMSHSADGDGGRSRLDLAKEVVGNVLSFTSFADYVSVIPFGSSNSPKPLMSGQLIKADRHTLKNLVEVIDELEASGSGGLAAAISEGFDVLLRSVVTNKEADCQKMIIVVSAGHFCAKENGGNCENGHLDLEGLHSVVENKQNLMREGPGPGASIFTFSVGEGSHNNAARQLACLNNGTWTHITGSDDVLFKLRGYMSMLASLAGDPNIIWSNFYEDDGGLGRMTTATRPIFSLSNAGHVKGHLIGVVGHDVLVKQLDGMGASFQSILGTVIERFSLCRTEESDVCQLQVVRGDDWQCPDLPPEHKCYKRRTTGHVYLPVAKSDTLTFLEASWRCQSLGGHLVDIDSDEELAFVSGIASPDGSWLGISKVKEGAWVWQMDRRLVGSGLWATGFQSDTAECGAIDSRGTSHNVQKRDCRANLAYICEFESEDEAARACKGGPMFREDNEYVPGMPNVTTCVREVNKGGSTDHAFISSESVMQAHSTGSVCPLGPPVTTEEVLCCENCSVVLENFENRNGVLNFPESNVASTSCPFIVLLIWALGAYLFGNLTLDFAFFD